MEFKQKEDKILKLVQELYTKAEIYIYSSKRDSGFHVIGPSISYKQDQPNFIQDIQNKVIYEYNSWYNDALPIIKINWNVELDIFKMYYKKPKKGKNGIIDLLNFKISSWTEIENDFRNKANEEFTNLFSKQTEILLSALKTKPIKELKLLETQESTNNIKNISDNNKIFIVHGHDKLIKSEVARTIEKLGFEVVILHEKPNKGKTIIEKLEENADVGFAIVLLTPDDRAKKSDEQKYKTRARQNVVFEFGYFAGKLGRERTVTLYRETKDFEKPSDLDGLLYIPYNEGWKGKIVQELKACGYKFDANKLYE